jgi:drug/metabolite transporter (DMT)-like permease
MHRVCLISILISVRFAVTTFFPILSKEFFTICPFPLLFTGFQTSASVPFAVLIGWVASGFQCSLSWFIPPRSIIWYLLASSVAYGLVFVIHNIGMFFCDLEFVIIIASAGMVWQGVLANLFLHEAFTWLSILAIVLVMSGTYLLSAKSQWQTERLSVISQIGIQLLLAVCQSAMGLTMKKALNIVQERGDQVRPWNITPFTLFVAQFPVWVGACCFEVKHWGEFASSMNLKLLGLLLFGVVLSQVIQVVSIALASLLSILANGIAAQLRTIASLILAHYFYQRDAWNQAQFWGIVLVSAATVVFAWSKKRETQQEQQQQQHERPTHAFSTEMNNPEEEEIIELGAELNEDTEIRLDRKVNR